MLLGASHSSLLTFSCVLGLAGVGCVQAEPPNVLLVMTDDQGYGDLGCHGNPILRTPELDKLHAESIRFTDFHVSPFCTPTRAALMTGNHPGSTGAYRTSSGRTLMHPDERTVAHLFADAGYVTGMVGKWHLGDNARFDGLDSEPVVGYNAGMRGKKSSVYDGGHRVPFFIYWPKGGLTGGKDVDTLAAHIDVLPTLADLCNIPVPEGYLPDGVSLKPLLDGSEDSWERNHHVVQYHGGAYGKALPPGPLAYSVVLTERWRLVNSDGQFLFAIQDDPAQRHDVSAQHPDVVARLRTRYDSFWHKVSPRMTPVRIDLGNPAEKRTVLCSQDWHMKAGNPPWNFNSIKKLPRVTGPWLVDVKRAGRYRITLRQWPAEANRPVVAVRARVKIAGQEEACAVNSGTRGVVFEMVLPAGPTDLVTYLYDNNDKAGGAYFTEVEYLNAPASNN